MNLETLNRYHEDGLLYKQTHPTLPLTIWNYAEKVQYEDQWNAVTIACRGLVTDDSGVIVARPFKKFFNIEENKHTPTDKFDVYEKMDGCCHEDTILVTNEGEKTIKEICDSNFLGKVLSYNTDNKKNEFKDILATSIIRNNGDWYEIELDDGIKIKLTGNHKIWLPELKCYRRVDELNGDELFLIYEKVD